MTIGNTTEPALLSTVKSVTASGAVVSTVKVIGSLAALVLPAASVAVTVRLCEPSASAGEVKDHVPFAPTTVEPSNVVPS